MSKRGKALEYVNTHPYDWGFVTYNAKTDDIEHFESGLSELVARKAVSELSPMIDEWRRDKKDWRIAVIKFVEVFE